MLSRMPSSSSHSRIRHCSGVSPGSSLPPGNSHFPACCMLSERCTHSRSSPCSIKAQLTWILVCFSTSLCLGCEGVLMPCTAMPASQHKERNFDPARQESNPPISLDGKCKCLRSLCAGHGVDDLSVEPSEMACVLLQRIALHHATTHLLGFKNAEVLRHMQHGR